MGGWLDGDCLNDGEYDVVREVVRPWTMAESCVELANASMKVLCDGVELNVANIRHDRVCFTEGHAPSYAKLANDSRYDEEGVGHDWRLPDGRPCGETMWEVVQ